MGKLALATALIPSLLLHIPGEHSAGADPPGSWAAHGSEMEKGWVCLQGHSLSLGQGWGQLEHVWAQHKTSCPTALCWVWKLQRNLPTQKEMQREME